MIDETTADGLPDARPKRNGWVPGTYVCRCETCEATFSGGKGAISCAACAYDGWEPTHRHVKTGGAYQFITEAKIEATLERVVVYEGQDGMRWIRPAAEFYDGRFIPHDGTPDDPAKASF